MSTEARGEMRLTPCGQVDFSGDLVDDCRRVGRVGSLSDGDTGKHRGDDKSDERQHCDGGYTDERRVIVRQVWMLVVDAE